MSSGASCSRRLVLGLGNILRSDEGLGVHALRALEGEIGPPADIELIDGGVLGMSLLPLVEEASHLLVLDAVDAGQPPGTLVELRRDQIPLFVGLRLSQHQITLQEVLALAGARGKLPVQLRLIGVQPADLAIGTELSAAVAATLPDVVRRAAAILQEWELL